MHGRFTALLARLGAPLMLLPFLIGCGTPNDATYPDQPYSVVKTVPTVSYAMDASAKGNRLIIAEDFWYSSVYDFTNPTEPAFLDTVSSWPIFAFQNASRVSMEPELNLFVLTFRTTSIMYTLDSLDYTTWTFGSGPIRGMVTGVKTDTVRSSFDNQLHEARVMVLVLADNDLSDALSVDYVYADSFLVGDVVNYRFNATRPVAGYSNNAQTAQGVCFYGPSLDTIAVGLGQRGVGLALVSRAAFPNGITISSVNTPGEATDVAAQNGWIYAADGNAGLAVVDATDPDAPTLAATWRYTNMDHAIGVAVHNHQLVVLDKFDGAFFLDVSDPAHPVYLGNYPVREGNTVKFIENGDLMIASNTEGVTFLHLQY